MNIKENFLPKSYVRELQSVIFSNMFPWYKMDETVSYNKIPKDSMTLECPIFIHGLYGNNTVNSSFYSLIKPVLYFIEEQYNCVFNVDRMKLNYMYKDSSFPSNNYNTPHLDSPIGITGYKTFLYYLNHSDGDTFFFNEYIESQGVSVKHRQTPIANAGMLFDSDMLHASSPPRTNDFRITLNIVLKDFKYL